MDMYATITRQKAKGSLKEIGQLAKETGLPDVEKAPGFVAYYVLELGNDQWATISVFERKLDADNWHKQGAEGVKRSTVKEFLVSGSGDKQVMSGKVLFSKVA
jgi:hypothetical protein